MTFVAAPGTTQFAKTWDPQPGQIVSFKHRGFLLSTKKPKLPTLHRLRPELTWEAVVSGWEEHKPSVPGTPTPDQQAEILTQRNSRAKNHAKVPP